MPAGIGLPGSLQGNCDPKRTSLAGSGFDGNFTPVLLDDLVTKEIDEPYRMMTSRAEYRLLLREDNADLRLSPLGYEIGLLPRERHEAAERKRRAMTAELERLKDTFLPPSSEVNAQLTAAGLLPINDGLNAYKLLQRPETGYELVAALTPPPAPLPHGRVREQYRPSLLRSERGIPKHQMIQQSAPPPQREHLLYRLT